ncbi:MAG: hypothetical protein IJD67_05580 [Clostridia bacterium]|nr:hypothetical protein [Clostridia bacterium]
MANTNKNNKVDFDEKVRKSELRQKKLTQGICLFLAVLMALGGTISVIVTVLAH